MYLSKSNVILGAATFFLIAVGIGSISAKETPEVVSSLKAIIASEEWDSPGAIQSLVEFPLIVTEMVALSWKCDTKCYQFEFKDYVSARKVFEYLHDSWKPWIPNKYVSSPSPFGEVFEGIYGVSRTGDCVHINGIVLNKYKNKVVKITIDGAKFFEDDSMKENLIGGCEPY